LGAFGLSEYEARLGTDAEATTAGVGFGAPNNGADVNGAAAGLEKDDMKSSMSMSCAGAAGGGAKGGGGAGGGVYCSVEEAGDGAGEKKEAIVDIAPLEGGAEGMDGGP
jgi:hypothetical protein